MDIAHPSGIHHHMGREMLKRNIPAGEFNDAPAGMFHLKSDSPHVPVLSGTG